MSTRFDILDAKRARDRHICNSTCHYPCTTLRALTSHHLYVAGKWGIEPGDDARQREQYNAMHGDTNV